MFKLITHNLAGKGCFGTLTDPNDEFICYTVEREWLNNEKNVSCIPAGNYKLVWAESTRFGRRLHLINENLGVSLSGQTQRNHCLFHAANEPHEVQGCIAPGMDWFSKFGVSRSKEALGHFEDCINSWASEVQTLDIVRL